MDVEAERAAMREQLDILAEVLAPKVEAGDREAERALRKLDQLRERLGPGDGEPVALDRLTMTGAALQAHIRAERDGQNPDWDALQDEMDWMLRVQGADFPDPPEPSAT